MKLKENIHEQRSESTVMNIAKTLSHDVKTLMLQC